MSRLKSSRLSYILDETIPFVNHKSKPKKEIKPDKHDVTRSSSLWKTLGEFNDASAGCTDARLYTLQIKIL